MSLLASARSQCRGLLTRYIRHTPHKTGAHTYSSTTRNEPARSYFQTRFLSTTSQSLTKWDALVDGTQALGLRSAYPHIEAPTPAQKALLKALDGDKDIFLKDRMGRGKTFGIALASVHLAKRGSEVLILVPTPQLLDLIIDHVNKLSKGVLTTAEKLLISITTPKTALSEQGLTAPDVIMIDEPETLLSPLPPRHLVGGALRSHPFYKHPPPLATLLDRLSQSVSDETAGTRMVWVGAELNGLLKRTIRHRGWAGLDALELDFESGSARATKDIGGLVQHTQEVNEGSRVEHLAFVVKPTGVTRYSLTGGTAGQMPGYRTGRPVIDDPVLEAVIRYQQDQPVSAETTTLILPPEGYPLDILANRLTAIASSTRVPMTIKTDVTASATADSEAIPSSNSILITSRSAVPGLDMPNLTRVILINGLDLAGVSPAQKARGGVKRRAAFYQVVSGRMGRLGSVTYNQPGQVVSFVSEGSGEELGLGMCVPPEIRRSGDDANDRL